MKKILLVALCLLMVFALVACNPEKEYEGEYSKTLKMENNEETTKDFKVKLKVKVDTSEKKVLSVTYVEIDDALLDSRTNTSMGNAAERDAFLALLANTKFELYKDLVPVEYYRTERDSVVATAQNGKLKETFGDIITSGGTNSKAFIISAVAKILKDNKLI